MVCVHVCACVCVCVSFFHYPDRRVESGAHPTFHSEIFLDKRDKSYYTDPVVHLKNLLLNEHHVNTPVMSVCVCVCVCVCERECAFVHHGAISVSVR